MTSKKRVCIYKTNPSKCYASNYSSHLRQIYRKINSALPSHCLNVLFSTARFYLPLTISLNASCHSYVVVNIDGKILVANGENDAETKEIYQRISEKVSKERKQLSETLRRNYSIFLIQQICFNSVDKCVKWNATLNAVQKSPRKSFPQSFLI